MKRTVALSLLGVAIASTAMGQGHVILSNYVSPYNSQVVWGANSGASGPVLQTDGIVLQAFYGAGVVVDENTLTPGVTFGIDDGFTYLGGGWYNAVLQTVPTVEAYTFQIRAVGGATLAGPVDELTSRSALFQIGAPPIVSTANPANPGGGLGLSVNAIPEPTTFALAGLGAAALLIFRRRD
jgi:hypothetical protein